MASRTFGASRPNKPHLVDGKSGVAGEVDDLRGDVEAAFTQLESGGGLLRTVEWTDPAAADVNAILTARASSASEDVIDENAAEWVGMAEMDPPRNITITTSDGGTLTDIDAVACAVVGTVRDENGDLIAQTDTITLTADAAATNAGTRAFSLVTSITVPAQTGTGGLLEVGFGDIIGLPVAMKERAGLLAPLREIESSSGVVTTGTFTTSTAQPPNGTYEPSTVPDGSEDYSLTYEVE